MCSVLWIFTVPILYFPRGFLQSFFASLVSSVIPQGSLSSLFSMGLSQSVKLQSTLSVLSEPPHWRTCRSINWLMAKTRPQTWWANNSVCKHTLCLVVHWNTLQKVSFCLVFMVVFPKILSSSTPPQGKPGGRAVEWIFCPFISHISTKKGVFFGLSCAVDHDTNSVKVKRMSASVLRLVNILFEVTYRHFAERNYVVIFIISNNVGLMLSPSCIVHLVTLLLGVYWHI